MKKFFRNAALLLGMTLASLPGLAQENMIQGYFRIQNQGNNNYVEVTGPFTARPDQNAKAAEKSAGTVMYVEAIDDGLGSYRLTHLRCQGIDVAMDAIDPDEYIKTIQDILDGGINSEIAYALVRQGFQYGYTSIARATVGTVFWIVASKLEGHLADDATNENYDKFYKGDYEEVAMDFNREVTAKLDLGIRLKPVSFEDKTVQVFFDVPSLKPVCDWYTDMDAKLFEGQQNPVSRHEVFASAMRSMHHYLVDEKGIDLETFLPEDIKLFSDWNYDITEKYSEYRDDEGNIKLDFDKIFSDEVLLFNWIKMVGYYILNPEKDNHGLSNLGYGDLASSAKNHYLTSLLVDYLPRLHYNTRAFLINGRVGEAATPGGSWDQSKDGTLGFASELEMAAAAGNGVWKLCPVDNETEKFVVEHKCSAVKDGEEFETSALYFDFPVSAVDSKTTFYTLSAQMYYTEIKSVKYTYNKVKDLDNYIEARTPFLIKTVEGGNSQLNVADGQHIFKAIQSSAEPTAPENALVISNEETAKQHAPVAPYYLSDESGSSLRGVLLPTSLTNDDLTNLWGETAVVYPYSEIKGVGGVEHVGFADKTVDALSANEAVYVPSLSSEDPIKEEPEEAMKSLEKSFVYIGEPESVNTGVQTVGSDVKFEKNVLYDLRGIRVEKPVPGNIYILNGQKVFIR